MDEKKEKPRRKTASEKVAYTVDTFLTNNSEEFVNQGIIGIIKNLLYTE